MQTLHAGKNSPPGWRHHGIVMAAQVLGVNRVVLWRVLVGRASNPGLLQRYQRLVENKSNPEGDPAPIGQDAGEHQTPIFN